MSGRTQFWLGSVMLAVAVGLLVGGVILPRPSYSQDAAEGRSSNFALVTSSLTGTRPKSQIVYIVDDRNEVMYVIETSANRGSKYEIRDAVDLRELGTGLQKKRAEDEKKKDKHRLP